MQLSEYGTLLQLAFWDREREKERERERKERQREERGKRRGRTEQKKTVVF